MGGGTDWVDTGFPPGWTWRHGPAVRAHVVGASHYQDELGRLLHGIKGDLLWAALFPEPDNPHDPNAVAVIAGGLRVGYLARAYARLWQPVVHAEHAAGRRAVGELTVGRGERVIKVRGRFVQPAPTGRWSSVCGPPVPVGREKLTDFWPVRHSRKRQRVAPLIDRTHMTSTEQLLFDQLMQCPEPFFFYPQYQFSDLILDFFCPHAQLCVEVDGPEHEQPDRYDRDRRRDYVLGKYGIATFRITNSEVRRNPRLAAAKVFTRACRRVRVYVPTNKASHYYGWKPAPPLRPPQSPRTT